MFYRNALLAAVCLIWSCFHLVPAHGTTDFKAARLKAAAANPPGVSVTLRLPAGRTQFHRGEVIPLSAVFTSGLPGKYDLNTDAGSRDLEWNSDAFRVDNPAGAADPLAVYYDREFGMSYNGPGPGFEPLATKPFTVSYTLNEWLRFDAPGHYRVYLTSGRVTDRAKRHEDLFFQGHAATSNSVEFDVLPDDPAWDAQVLKSALPLYDAEGFDYKTQAARAEAVRVIRFLGTPDAGRAMVARCGHPADDNFIHSPAYFETRLGLFGFPDREFIVQQMQRQIAAPDFPVSIEFLQDLAQVRFLAAYSQPVLPYDPAHDSKRRELIVPRRKAFQALSEEGPVELAAAAPTKTGRAKALSFYALLQADYQHPHTPRHRDLARALVPVFDDLSLEEQNALLDDNGFWPKIRGLEMLPVLRRLYAKPVSDEGVGNWQEVESLDQHSLALRRLTELSPAEGRVLLLAEIKSRNPSVDLPTLCSLPDRSLPALDDILAANLESVLSSGSGDWRVAPRLVERYATASILPRVKAAYGDKGGKWACDIQSSLLAYFLRTDRAYGTAQLEKALAARKDTDCYRSVLSDVAALHAGPDVERLAVLHLNDPDTAVAADAAKTLGEYGSPAAEAALWARLREWHMQWAGKDDQIEPTDAHIPPQPGKLEYALIEAIVTAPGWLTNQAQLQALDKLCVTQRAHGNVTSFLQDWAETVQISCSEDAGPWQVVQYHSLPTISALEAKLSQFPRGTRFQLSPFGFSGQAAQAQAFTQLSPFLMQHGMSLTLEPFPHPQPK